MARPRIVRLAPGVSGEDLTGKPVRTIPQGTRAQIAKRRQGWWVGGKRWRDPYAELGL